MFHKLVRALADLLINMKVCSIGRMKTPTFIKKASLLIKILRDHHANL